MKVPLFWLREFVPDAPDADAVGEALTLGGLPVEHVEVRPDGDRVLDVEVTSNRSDCLSIVGVAREVAALLKLRFVAPVIADPPAEAGSPGVSVSVEDAEACPYYSARVLRGVRVAPSPAWLVARLDAVGVRAINNVVDVTNYVLFELGQPLHAFDLARLEGGRVVVRRANAGEKIVTLDGHERSLAASALVIADAARAVALAGVMGGETSGVTYATTDVLLESARFDPMSVRRTARALALASDSSYRFERGLDPTLARRASDRAVGLLLALAGGRVEGPIVGRGDPAPPPARASLRTARMNRLLGVEWTVAQAHDALVRLGFEIVEDPRHAARHAAGDPSVASILEAKGLSQVGAPQHVDALTAGARVAVETLEVIVPSHRLDVRLEVDLIEEVARIVGYEHIPIRDSVSVRLTQPEPARVATALIGRALNAAGFFEALTFSFVSDALAEPFRHDEAARLHKVVAATRRTDAQLRPSILPNLLESVKRNEDLGTPGARLFETASTFWIDANGASVERRALGIVGDDDYRALRGAVEAALARLDARRSLRVMPASRAGFGSGACGAVTWGDVPVGYIGKLDRAVAEQIGLRGLPAMAELWLEPLIAGYEAIPRLAALPTFPAVRRDLSLLLAESVRFEQVAGVVEELKLDALEDVAFVTTYRGKPLEKGTKSVTFTLAFRRPDGTLTSGEVDERVGRVVELAKAKLGATLRS